MDLAWAEALLDRELGGRMQARRGELIDALGDGGLIAELRGRPVGLVFWRFDREASATAPSRPSSAEITAVVVQAGAEGQGVGRALMRGAEEALRGSGVARVWLVTTNENLAALALYQKVGFRLTALRAGAIDEIRRTIKPHIPLVSGNGIAVHDELELELRLAPTAVSERDLGP